MTASTHDVNYFFSVCAESIFKACFLEKYFYNSRIGKSSLSFYNFGMELLPNIMLVWLESPYKKIGNLVCISQNWGTFLITMERVTYFKAVN